MRDILVVFSNPLGDRHAEFNDWYSNVHIRDVMRMPSSVGVQRFILADDQPQGFATSAFRYLAVYETDDSLKCTAAHAVAMTPKLPISETFDLTSPCNYFRLRSFVTADPMAARDGDIVVAEFDDPAAFDCAAAARLAGQAGVLSVAHFGVMGDQLIPRDPTRPEMALIRLAGASVGLGGLDLSGFVPANAIVSHYRPLIRRLAADDVLHPTPDAQAIEDRARAALEGKLHQLVFEDGVVKGE